MGTAVKCAPSATVKDMCCIPKTECPPELTEDPPQFITDELLQAWCDSPNGPKSDYPGISDEAYAWLVKAEQALSDATDWVLRKTCGLPTGKCTRRYRKCTRCPSRDCRCGGNCMLLPETGPILDIEIKIWDKDGDPNTPDRILKLDQDFYLHCEGTQNYICLYEEDCAVWPPNRYRSRLGKACTWEICITTGCETEDIPGWIRQGIADKACQMMNKCLPADKCATYIVPDHTTQVGDIKMLTILDYYKNGLTGITSLDEVLVEFDCTRYGSRFNDPAISSDFYERS